jgi:hypothetical protein
MWLVTTRGFVSAVEWQRRGDGNDGKIVLRARDRNHLESVVSLIGAPEVLVSPSADYRYRAFVTRKQFEKLIVALAREVTYPNFKNAVYARQGRSRYETILHRVWDLFAKLQPGGPYGSGGKGYPQIPKGEPRRAAGRQNVSLLAAPPRCDDCGHEGDDDEFVVGADGEALCADVMSCLDRSGSLPATG